jgi:tRNA-dihydrouridine synthase B
MYKGDADWTEIARVKNNPRIAIPIFGNGDIDSPEKALDYKSRYGVDGIMIGRAAIGYPWIFNEIKHFVATGNHLPLPTLADRVEAARNHLQWAIEWKGERLGVFETRRHYTNYFKGIPNFKEYRQKLVTNDAAQDVYNALDEILQRFGEESLIIQ